ncbi:alpha/beta hydrolase [Oceaniserpentilla sp. 4NH20-0058]|uniref:alpha/beta fold hydrolase n=1 Tax=Oceaniserpentilla sp. 4NH20-0058 TaxID=3127660 RepID=UPI00310C8157
MISTQPVTTIRANNIEIAYELYGNENAPVIMLIHGLGMPMTAWPMTMVNQLVEAGYRVLRIDNRDQGQSEKLHHLSMPNMIWQVIKLKLGLQINPPYPLTELMNDAIGVLDALNIEKAHLVGVSMGGMISQLIAINAPERVKSLTSIMSSTSNPKLPKPSKEVSSHLMSGPASKSKEDILNYHMKTWKLIGSPMFPTSDSDLKTYVQSLLDRGISAAGTQRQMLAIIGTHNRYDELAKLSIPVQVIHGTADPLIPISAGKETAEAANAKLHVVEGMGHDLPLQIQPRICDWILEQVSSVECEKETAAAM